MSELRRTPLYARHLELGARMIDFAGFSLPLQYDSIMAEHRAVRESAGIFDVSHMGQIRLSGPGAIASGERLLTCPVGDLAEGRVRYGLLCNPDGGCVDDVTVYREGPDSLLLCVNAANIDKDRAWIESERLPGTHVHDLSAETALLALQGPQSAALIDRLCSGEDGTPPSRLGRFRFGDFRSPGGPGRISRTGYTGADGFEIYLPAARCAALPLYGHELDDGTSPLEAGLGRFVKRESGGFIGHEAMEERERRGRERQLVGFELEGRGVARAGHPIAIAGREVGRVTSGAPSPSLGKSVGLGYVPPENARPGTPLEILVRQKAVKARTVPTPFVPRP